MARCEDYHGLDAGWHCWLDQQCTVTTPFFGCSHPCRHPTLRSTRGTAATVLVQRDVEFGRAGVSQLGSELEQ